MYDYLIVGSGLFGAVFAHQAKQAGKKCLVIEKRNYQGGNVSCLTIEGITVHMHGPHIFHTNDEGIWKFVNSFVRFNPFTYSPMAKHGGKLYNLPFNMNTFYQIWGVTTPEEAMARVQGTDTFKAGYRGSLYGNYYMPVNLEQQAISSVGTTVYELLVKHYTEKQWGRPCSQLPASIIRRLPVRYTFDNNYFNDTYQGIPEGGYNRLVSALLEGIEVRLSTDFFSDMDHFRSIARKIVYTGPLDQLYNYRFGDLEYRSLQFDHTYQLKKNIQGCAVINHTGPEVPYTRSIEHKHFDINQLSNTGSVLTYEFPCKWERGKEPYYPVNDQVNNARYSQYEQLAKEDTQYIIGGRLGSYRYYDMHQVIAAALKAAKTNII